MALLYAKGKTVLNPCGFFCSIYDVQDWGAAVMQERADAGQLLAVLAPAGDGVARNPELQPLVNQMQAWYLSTAMFEGFDDAGLKQWAATGGENPKATVARESRAAQRGYDLNSKAREVLGIDAPVGSGETQEAARKKAEAYGVEDAIKAGAALLALSWVGRIVFDTWKDRD